MVVAKETRLFCTNDSDEYHPVSEYLRMAASEARFLTRNQQGCPRITSVFPGFRGFYASEKQGTDIVGLDALWVSNTLDSLIISPEMAQGYSRTTTGLLLDMMRDEPEFQGFSCINLETGETSRTSDFFGGTHHFEHYFGEFFGQLMGPLRRGFPMPVVHQLVLYDQGPIQRAKNWPPQIYHFSGVAGQSLIRKLALFLLEQRLEGDLPGKDSVVHNIRPNNIFYPEDPLGRWSLDDSLWGSSIPKAVEHSDAWYDQICNDHGNNFPKRVIAYGTIRDQDSFEIFTDHELRAIARESEKLGLRMDA